MKSLMQRPKKSYSAYLLTLLLLGGLVVLSLTACRGGKTGAADPLLQTVETLLWQDAGEAEHVLQLVDSTQLSSYDANCYHVLTCFVRHRLNRTIQPDDIPLSLLQELLSCGNKRYLVYGYYLRGRAYMVCEQLPEAMESLKQAEMYLNALADDDPCGGLLYYCIGNVLEKELLNTSAFDFYQLAEESFRRADRLDYLVYCYRDMARTCVGSDESGNEARERSEHYYDKSLEMADRIGDTVQAAVTMLHREAERIDPDSALLCRLAIWLTDTAGLNLYADIAAECLLRKHDMKQAERYIELLRQQQGSESVWAMRRYRELCSLRAAMTGDTKNAYRILSSLYTDEQLRAAEEAGVRAFILEKQFDLNAERETNRHLRGEKFLILIIACLVAVVLILAIVILYIRLSRTRMRHEFEQQMQHSKAQAQEREIKTMSRQLQRLLKERVRTSRNLLCGMMGEQGNIKANTRRQLQDLLLLDEKQWKTFVQEFEMAHNGLLAQLRNNYPSLTESDLQYIALAYLGLDNADICILLQMQERTLWNRRQRIKNHLGEPTMNLDDWIAGIGLSTNSQRGTNALRKTPRQKTTGKKKAQALVILVLIGLFIGPAFAAHLSYLPQTEPAMSSDSTTVAIPNLQQDTVGIVPDTDVTTPDTITRPASRRHVRHPAIVPIHSDAHKLIQSE